MLSLGASIGYFQGDVRKLIDDIGALRPTMFVGVPRVFERIYDGVQGQVRWGMGGEEEGTGQEGTGREGKLLCVCVLGMPGGRGWPHMQAPPSPMLLPQRP